VGAQIGGAIKNVIAIACGIVEGKGLGDNARAALMTRGLAEMLRFGRTKGARPETLMGLSGLGDLALTCNGRQSRNMSLGMALGQGRAIDEVLGTRRSVAEGVATAQAIAQAAEGLAIELPIARAVDRICNRGADIEAEIGALLARPFTREDA
jgi:glycerol-3-phosphate dehydrogenase (NAD(P)+)